VFSGVRGNVQSITSGKKTSRCTGIATPAQTALEVFVFLGPSEPTPEASSSIPRGLQQAFFEHVLTLFIES
jgi:hypothetical protein